MIWWLGVSAFLASLLGTWAVRGYARRHAVFDVPNERSSHVSPTPRGGGLAFVIVIVVLTSILAVTDRIATSTAAAIVIGGLLLGTVGWVDDTRGLRPSIRLVIQIVAAVIAVTLLGGLPSVAAFGRIVDTRYAGAIMAVVGLVWLTNLFNFMDGIDGIAASQGAVASATAALVLLRAGDTGIGSVAAITSAALVGFLCWNWAPASIFMGDVGSGFIGFMVGVLGIASEHDGHFGVLAALTVASPFVVDATLTLFRRLLRGERPWSPHRTHAYQRAALWCGAHAPVAVAYICLAGGVGIGTTRWLATHRDAGVPCVVALVALSLLYGVWSSMSASARATRSDGGCRG